MRYRTDQLYPVMRWLLCASEGQKTAGTTIHAGAEGVGMGL